MNTGSGLFFFAGIALDHLHGDRLALHLTQLQRRNRHAAVLFRQQGDDPARGRTVVAIEGVQLVDLARATHLEQRFQRRQVGLAELGDIVGFEGEFDRLAGVQATAIHAGRQLGRLGGGHADQQGQQESGEAGHRVFP